MSKTRVAKLNKIISDLTEEYIEKEGGITAEFSTSVDMLPHIVDMLRKANNRLLDSTWTFYDCSTCKGYDSDKGTHVEIVKRKHYR